MAADPNMGFCQDAILASALNRHSISFQSGAVSSTSGMIPMGSSFGVGSSSRISRASSSSSVINNSNPSSSIINNTPSSSMMNNTPPSSMMNNNPSSSIVNNGRAMITPGVNSNGGLLVDSVPGLNHELELAVEWSIEEQSKLEDGLIKYADETSIMRYVKVAATLPEKTVRDVALRCRWMTKKENGKRRKVEENYTGKKIKDRKEKLVESSTKSSIPTSPSLNMSGYPLMLTHMDHSDQLSCEVLGSATRNLLGENAQLLSQITSNLATFKMQDNIDLFCHTKNNITAILNNMRDMPGIMSQMPPLPVSVNEELVNYILPTTPQAMMFGSPSSNIYLKQEPRC